MKSMYMLYNDTHGYVVDQNRSSIPSIKKKMTGLARCGEKYTIYECKPIETTIIPSSIDWSKSLK
jgi:hypothetical protein